MTHQEPLQPDPHPEVDMHLALRFHDTFADGRRGLVWDGFHDPVQFLPFVGSP